MRWLVGGIVLLAVLNIVDLALGEPLAVLTRLISLGQEANLATWYSSLILLVAAGFSCDCWRITRHRRLQGAGVLAAVTAILVLMSCDEVAQLHETVGNLAGGVARRIRGQAVAWVWLIGPPIAAILVALAWSLRSPLSTVPRCFATVCAGFGLIIFAGVGLEAAAFVFFPTDAPALKWAVIAEETLELVGAILLAFAFHHWARTTTLARADQLGQG